MSKMPEPDDFPENEIIFEVYCHVIFWTPRLRPLLTPKMLAAACQEMDQAMFTVEGEALAAGGSDNHLHILTRMSPNHSVEKSISAIKKRSKEWAARDGGIADFRWHGDYVVVTIGSDADDIKSACDFINSQQSHHEMVSFQGELRAVFDEYGFEWDERKLFE